MPAAAAPETVAKLIQDFLGEAPRAVVREDGEVVFDFASARYSLSTEHGKCVLHLWSQERNAVRRVLDAEQKEGTLRLEVLRFGRSAPDRLELCRDRDERTPSARRAARTRYQKLLERALLRHFPGARPERFTTAMDLERSFGPIHTRGLLRHGNSSFAVLGVNAGEMQAAVDASLTFGLLWLDHCRRDARALVEGLALFVPPQSSAVLRERMAQLDHAAAKFRLYEFHEGDLALEELDCRDRGNIATRLVRCPDQVAVRDRFGAQIEQVRAIVPDCEVAVLSSYELSFRLRGLEFACARLAADPHAFRNPAQLVFGAPPQETVVSEENLGDFRAFARMLSAARCSGADQSNALFRMHPERWLESLVIQDLSRLDHRLLPAPVYSQVPAFSASDRAMIDVLGLTHDKRLAVIELKADEDIHLPLQGIDYWARVAWHHQRREFRQFGYFAGCELSAEPPLLLLVAPALRVHPATDALLRYISPEIECELLGIDERWREELKVVFRKRPQPL
ncbi:MAG TPA: hypothetical protein VLA96_10255 [Terriglobales bacterium]|nr:hypothetical protein [Terriglobales bacterium]